jgi:hypothetical protein
MDGRVDGSSRNSGPGRRSRASRWGLALGSVALPLIVLSLVLILTTPSSGGAGNSALVGGPLYPVQTAAPSGPILSLGNSSIVATEASTFLGANVRPYYSLGSAETSAYQSAGLQYVRWPGGDVVEAYNVTANVIYNDNGTSGPAPTNVSTFAHWCKSVGCHAIIGLPAEIDRPSTAAYYVSYIERTVGFTPSYWEIGNEPSIWTHFGVSWAKWNTSQDENATPTTYATLLHQYIAAIRSVDPAARFVALGGIGTGAWGEPTWISAAVKQNGANLSAVSIHVYPAGGITSGSQTAGSFYSTLQNSNSISVRVPLDRVAIAQACPSCHIAIFVTELGSGSTGGPFSTYMGGFPVVPYLAAEVVQALELNLTQVDLFAFEGSYNGSLLNDSGTPTGVATLYHSFLRPLDPEILSTNLSQPARGFYVLPTRTLLSGESTILVVNTNVSATLSFQVRPEGELAVYQTLTVWSPGDPAPIATTSATTSTIAVRVPPESVALLQVGGGIILNHALPTPVSPAIGISLALPAPTVQGVLTIAAPTSMTFPCWAVASARRPAKE